MKSVSKEKRSGSRRPAENPRGRKGRGEGRREALYQTFYAGKNLIVEDKAPEEAEIRRSKGKMPHSGGGLPECKDVWIPTQTDTQRAEKQIPENIKTTPQITSRCGINPLRQRKKGLGTARENREAELQQTLF